MGTTECDTLRENQLTKNPRPRPLTCSVSERYSGGPWVHVLSTATDACCSRACTFPYSVQVCTGGVDTCTPVGSPVALAGLGGTAGGGEGPAPDPGLRVAVPPAPPGASFLPSVLGDRPPPFISHGFSEVAMIDIHARRPGMT